MPNRATRLLVNTLSIVGIIWIGYVIYGSFTRSGVWRAVLRATSSEYSYSPAGTFALCTLMGLVPLIALGWAIWRVFLRGRD
jgi:hypothetical protein